MSVGRLDTRKDRRPNVIWVFGDQHRGQALGCMGDPNVDTPNIDRMAATGVHFTNALSGYPLCSPARGSILTGRYPHHCVRGHEFQMPEDQRTIAHVMNDAGYDTAYFGKWHIDGFKEVDGRAAFHVVPPERRGGFQKWIGYENNNSQWDSWVHGDDPFGVRPKLLQGYETDALTDLLTDYVVTHEREKPDAPFFAVLSFQPPHDPYVAPEEYMRRHKPGDIQLRPNVPLLNHVTEVARRDLSGYYAMIENLDFNVGRIINALAERNILYHTHVIFFSDHGDMHGAHGQFRKTTPYEEAIRVPFVVFGEESAYYTYYNGKNTGRVGAPLNTVDIAPTTLGLCDIVKPDWMEGSDYSHFVDARKPERSLPDSAFLQSVTPTGHPDSIDRPWRGVVTEDRWKYVCFEGVPWLLFNLSDDPYEQVNLAYNSRFAQERRKLQSRLAEWISSTGDEFVLPEL